MYFYSNLSYQRYYVDVWEADHDNYTLAAEEGGWIETPELHGLYDHTFIAYVDYYEAAKKSTSRADKRSILMLQGPNGKKRDLKINKITKPREKK